MFRPSIQATGRIPDERLMPSNNITSISGVVESINEKGFKLESGQWLNYSQYGYGGPQKGQPAPQPGQTISAQLKNDKFLHTLTIGGTHIQNVAPPTQAPATPPQPAAVMPLPPAPLIVQALDSTKLADTTLQVKLAVLKTLAVAQPALFDVDKIEPLLELARQLQEFILEDLIEAITPIDDSDVTADDLLDEDI